MAERGWETPRDCWQVLEEARLRAEAQTGKSDFTVLGRCAGGGVSGSRGGLHLGVSRPQARGEGDLQMAETLGLRACAL